jgi:hypothetical protein
MRRLQSFVLFASFLACGDSRSDDSVLQRVRAASPAPRASEPAGTLPAPVDSSATDSSSATWALASAASDTLSIRLRVDSIDALETADPSRLRLFATVPGRAGLLAVQDTLSWPGEVDASFALLYDDAGRLVFHSEVPSSESGDWYMESQHYFDPDGRTIFHRAHVSGFGSECTQILRETVRSFFDARTGTVIARTSAVTDRDENPVRDVSTCYRRIGNVPKPRAAASALTTP